MFSCAAFKLGLVASNFSLICCQVRDVWAKSTVDTHPAARLAGQVRSNTRRAVPLRTMVLIVPTFIREGVAYNRASAAQGQVLAKVLNVARRNFGGHQSCVQSGKLFDESHDCPRSDTLVSNLWIAGLISWLRVLEVLRHRCSMN